MLSNKSLGNTFEKELQKIFHENGWWVHIFQQNSSGQPCDLIAAKNGKTYLIDAKVISGKGFPLSRIEDNQEYAMTMFKDRGNTDGWFAMKLPDGEIRLFTLWTLLALRQYQSSIPNEEILKDGISIERWLKKYGT